MQVLESWLTAMRLIIPQLDPMHVFVHVVGYVKSITETLQASVQTRLIATHLLGIAVVALSKEEVETRLLDKVLFLCQVNVPNVPSSSTCWWCQGIACSIKSPCQTP